MNRVKNLDINKFMGDWYVVAGRTTFLEKGAYNSLEQYTWNDKKKRIDITFSFNKNSFDGSKKVIRQKAWIEDKVDNSLWKVQPFWPLKLDYVIIDIDENYQWTSVGTPNQNYLWIMSRTKKMEMSLLTEILIRLREKGFRTDNVKVVEHN